MMTYTEIKTAMEEIATDWNEKVIECAYAEHKQIPIKDFLSKCTACGGNWGGMLLSGMSELYPKTYAAIPDNMGVNAFALICDTLMLLGIDLKENA